MSTGKGGGGGGKGGSFAPSQSYSPFTPVASGNGTGYYNPSQQLAPSAYNPMMDAYGSRQNVMQPMSGYYNQYQLPGSNYQPYQPPAPQPAQQPYQPFQPFQPPVQQPQPQAQPNNNFFSNTSSYNPFRNQGGNYNTFGGGYGNSYANFTPDYSGQQNFYEPRPNYFGRPSQNPFQSQAPALAAPAPAPTAAPTPAPAQNYNYSTEPDEVYQEQIITENPRATDPGMPVEPSYNRFAEGNQAPILNIRATDSQLSDERRDGIFASYNRFSEGNQAPQPAPQPQAPINQEEPFFNQSLAEARQPLEPAPQPQAPLNPPLDQNGPLGDIMQMAVGKLEPDLQYDANGDGRITSRDALMFQQSVAPEPAPEPMPEPMPEPVFNQPVYSNMGPQNIPFMPILDYQQPTVQQRYQQTIAARQQPQYVAPEPRIYGHQRTAQMPILDSADQVSATANNPGFSGYDQNMFAPMQFGGIYV